MVDALTLPLIAGCLALGAWAGVAAARDRRVTGAQLLFAVAVEVLLLAQAVVSLVLLARGGTEAPAVLFVGYLLTAVLLLPVGALWAIGERSRWGNGVLALAGVVVAVLVLRLQQIWDAGA